MQSTREGMRQLGTCPVAKDDAAAGSAPPLCRLRCGVSLGYLLRRPGRHRRIGCVAAKIWQPALPKFGEHLHMA